METKTLHQLCDALNISRRTVQGYEQAGLVQPSGKNSRGYLLYNEEAQLIIQRIKLYQQFGFHLKEIAILLEAPNVELKSALKKQIEKMEEEKKEKEKLIQIAYQLLHSL